MPNLQVFDQNPTREFLSLSGVYEDSRTADEIISEIHESPKNSNRFNSEDRDTAFGKTNHFRFLALTFILRKNRIRVISARDMSAREKKQYENT